MMKDRNVPREKKMKGESATPDKSAVLTRDVQAKIGQQLRAMYGDVVEQGVPDRFVDLLRKLDAKDGDGKPE